MRFIIKALCIGFGAMLLISCCSCGGDAEPTAQPTPTMQVTPTPSPAPTVTPTPPILVNYRNPIPADYGVELRELDNGQAVAAECYDALTEMLSDCAEAGNRPVVCSGYRSILTQSQLFENKISRLMQNGYGYEDAERLAATEVARPGTSEHHTGLAVDIVDSSNYALDETQEQTPTQQWLMVNSYRYGFILRYPKDKTDYTGIIYEPWHYRYVGTDIAQVIYENDLCLEEYWEQHQ